MFGGASLNELGLVAFLVALIMIAPKVSRIGEVVGGLFERSGGPDAGAGSDEAGDEASHDQEG
ncbi:Hypothetical protein CAP_8280 [Chondromyces apiculatus DSM 436]|uniref:Uncharacterized protein n=1 Tax=Chondromyces apiculatus DSM 436 TaxID=1192034 RepID=A0A017SXF5_9BACT|nr:Hypothetical protein CAP_8280 [Chondromyces apiculatus DSM 436]